MKFNKILIANRGEIAVRVIRACRELSIKAVAIYSEVDRLSRHVQVADEAWLLEGQPGKVYLDIEQIISLAKRSGAEAIHPGYGFLAENAEFARACTAAGITFIGPKPEVILAMGSKIESRRIMEKAGVPVVPGTTDPITDVAKVKELCAKFGYPIAIKASAGGGGRGLRVVRKEEEVEQALAGAQREGASYFGNGEVYLEKYLDHPRHIEVQILADEHGNVVHLGERDCSTQRRHQKLIEESPAANLPPAVRQRLLDAAVLAAKAIGYSSAGTVEGLVSGDDYYFLEMNTRVQVEHPVTEFVTGIDIVKEQIRIAAGEPLSFSQDEVVPRGHAIEFRINAEDPFKQFMPSPGTVSTYIEPSIPWVRIDSACYPGYQILPFYDSLLAKLIVWGRNREEAIDRSRVALREFIIEGVKTTIPFHQLALEDEVFQQGRVYTSYIESEFRQKMKPPAAANSGAGGNGNGNGNGASGATSGSAASAASAAGGANPAQPPALERQAERKFEVEVNQKHFKVTVAELKLPGEETATQSAKPSAQIAGASGKGQPALTTKPRQARKPIAAGNGEIRAQMHGLVKEVLVAIGETVKTGQRLLIFEAMKMESDIVADCDGLVETLKVKTGDTVEVSEVMVVIGKN